MTARPVLRVARLTLEATAPLSIASGAPSLTEDVPLARDPNGLPFAPGTSLAGVLRGGFVELASEAAACDLFGDPLLARKDPRPGRLAISDALCLGEAGKPVDGMDELPVNDRIFALLAGRPVTRDHVRLNGRGAVDGAGKFTRAAIPRGVRFLAQIELWDAEEEGDPGWRKLLDALCGPLSRLRLGGATRAGYGEMRVVALEDRAFDMRKPEDRAAARLTASLAAPLGGDPREIEAAADAQTYRLTLKPEGLFRFGQGAVRAGENDPADLRPLRETVIAWGADGAPPDIRPDRLFIPASAVKGALRHRTAFHFRRLTGAFAGETFDEDEALAPLFGVARDGDGGETKARGEAGRVFIDDIPLAEAEIRRIDRTGIDRFSGGVRRGALFSEDAVDRDAPLILGVRLERAREIDARLIEAFEHALADLAHGWLALGAGGTKGLGVFRDPDPDERLKQRRAERMQA